MADLLQHAFSYHERMRVFSRILFYPLSLSLFVYFFQDRCFIVYSECSCHIIYKGMRYSSKICVEIHHACKCSGDNTPNAPVALCWQVVIFADVSRFLIFFYLMQNKNKKNKGDKKPLLWRKCNYLKQCQKNTKKVSVIVLHILLQPSMTPIEMHNLQTAADIQC